jgi:signal transduction histidine kinase/CheY-like chemotaxis protein
VRPDTDPASRLERLPRLVLASVAALGVALAALAAFDLARDLREREAFGDRLLRGHAAAVAGHTAATLAEAASTVDLVAREIELAGGAARLDEATLHRILRRRLHLSPRFGSLTVIRPDGVVGASTIQFPIRAVSLADRDHFLAHAGDASGAVTIWPAVRSKLDGRWRVFVARRAELPGGGFGGVVTLGLDVGVLDALYRSFAPPAGAVVSLARPDGSVLLTSPLGPDGGPLAIRPLRPEALAADPRAAGAERIGVAAPVEGFPISAVVSVDGAATNARWESEVAEVAVFALLYAATAALAAYLVRYVRDLAASERRRRDLEDEVFRASKLESLGVLAGGIAHDFNNLLAGILANVEAARAGGPPELAAPLDDAARAARRATGLTRQLLAFSRGGAPVRERVALGELLGEAAGFVVRGSPSRVALELAPGLWEADGDPGQLAQVIQNLVINADQAMPGGGTIRVAARNRVVGADDPISATPGRYVELTVADAGVGISPEDLTRIFDPFFTTKASGTGLGLSTVHAIVRRHGGAIAVDSRPGEGTRFTVLVPAAAPAPDGARAPAPPASPAAAPARAAVPGAEEDAVPPGTRVLVVDDEELLRRSAARVLRRLRCEVETCADGAEALERYRVALGEGRPFDVVVTDLTIPGGMGGQETAERLTALDPAVRIVVSTGYSAESATAGALPAVKAWLPKPYGPEDMRRALSAALVA